MIISLLTRGFASFDSFLKSLKLFQQIHNGHYVWYCTYSSQNFTVKSIDMPAIRTPFNINDLLKTVKKLHLWPIDYGLFGLIFVGIFYLSTRSIWQIVSIIQVQSKSIGSRSYTTKAGLTQTIHFKIVNHFLTKPITERWRAFELLSFEVILVYPTRDGDNIAVDLFQKINSLLRLTYNWKMATELRTQNWTFSCQSESKLTICRSKSGNWWMVFQIKYRFISKNYTDRNSNLELVYTVVVECCNWKVFWGSELNGNSIQIMHLSLESKF